MINVDHYHALFGRIDKNELGAFWGQEFTLFSVIVLIMSCALPKKYANNWVQHGKIVIGDLHLNRPTLLGL